jgi:hypothetical protein
VAEDVTLHGSDGWIVLRDVDHVLPDGRPARAAGVRTPL